jgi:hypothetical protein
MQRIRTRADGCHAHSIAERFRELPLELVHRGTLTDPSRSELLVHSLARAFGDRWMKQNDGVVAFLHEREVDRRLPHGSSPIVTPSALRPHAATLPLQTRLSKW